MTPMRAKNSVGALHEPGVPERGSVTRRTWGCSDALRLTEPRSHRVVRFMVPIHAEKTKEGSLHEPAVARELPVRSADRDRSPVAACGPRQHPWKITHALVFARPLRAGTARGPNLTPIFPHIPLARHQHALLRVGHKVGVFFDQRPHGLTPPMPFGNSRSESQRDSSLEPRVARRATLGGCYVLKEW